MRYSIGLLAAVLAALAGVQIACAQEEAPPPVRVAVNGVIGPPQVLSQELRRELAALIDRQQNVVVAGKGKATGLFLKWYVLAQTEKDGTKVSYVLDVENRTGRRLNRFEGDETADGPFENPWAVFTPSLTQSLAAKAAASFTAWLPRLALNSDGPPR